jgi:hypothetical protein
MEAAGRPCDPWQADVLDGAMGERDDGIWASSEVGLIVPRQNGKGDVLAAKALHSMYLSPVKLILWSAHEFKALDVETPILTAGGWSTMGALVDGDEVFAPDGSLTKVVAAHPWRHGRPCFRLKFDDGQEVVADAEHLWEVVEASTGRRVVLSTAEIVAAGVSTVELRSGRPRRTYRFRVDLPAPLSGMATDLPVPPWLFGAWLGDGTSAKGDLTVGAEDLEYVLARLDALGETYRIRPDRRWPDRVFTVIVAGLVGRLRQAGVLGAKHIPDRYMLAADAQRRELLAGVMDTDGTVSAHQIAVTMSNARLMDDVASLVRSLGYKASLREFRASLNGNDAGPMYRVQFSASQDVSPFGMPRKSAKLRSRQTRTTRAHYNAIVAVDPVETRPTRCITVAHESSLYLAGRGFVPTHNTAREMFLRVREIVDGCHDLSRRVRTVRTSHGEEGIELLDGTRLGFVARSRGSGRGFSPEELILDEAYALTDEQVSAMMPSISAQPNPQIWYASSHPLALSVVLRRICRRGRAGGAGLAYFDWSADPSLLSDDREAWAAANPALGIRLSPDSIVRELGSMDEADFRRERLGIVNLDDNADRVVDQDTWKRLIDGSSKPLDPVAFAVDVTPDRASAAIGVAGYRADGLRHNEVVEQRAGTRWVVDRLVQLVERWKVCAVALDPSSPAGALIPDLQRKGITTDPRPGETLLEIVGGSSMGQACGGWVDAVTDEEAPQVRHLDQAPLNAALAGAKPRPMGDGGFKWSRKDSSVDISPLVAVTLADYALALHGGQQEDTANPWFAFGYND